MKHGLDSKLAPCYSHACYGEEAASPICPGLPPLQSGSRTWSRYQPPQRLPPQRTTRQPCGDHGRTQRPIHSKTPSLSVFMSRCPRSRLSSVPCTSGFSSSTCARRDAAQTLHSNGSRPKTYARHVVFDLCKACSIRVTSADMDVYVLLQWRKAAERLRKVRKRFEFHCL